MIEMYKIGYGLYDRNATAGLFERNDRDSRGNACKVVVPTANLEMRKNFFTIRAPLDWCDIRPEWPKCNLCRLRIFSSKPSELVILKD